MSSVNLGKNAIITITIANQIVINYPADKLNTLNLTNSRLSFHTPMGCEKCLQIKIAFTSAIVFWVAP